MEETKLLLDSLFSKHQYLEYINEVDQMTDLEKLYDDYPHFQQRKALAYARLGKHNSAINEYKIAIELLKSNNYDTKDILDAYQYLGNSFLYLDLDSCLYYREYVISESRLQPKNLEMQLARALQGKGQVLLFMENYINSRDFLDEAEQIFLNSDDENAQGSLSVLYSTKSHLFRKFGDYKKSLLYNQKTLAIRTKLYGDSSIMVAGDYNNLAAAYSYLNENNKSLINYNKSLQIIKKQSDINYVYLFKILTNLSSVFYREGQYEESLKHLFESIKIGEDIHIENRARLIYNYTLIGDCYRILTDTLQAKNFYTKSMKCALDARDDRLSYPMIELGKLAILNNNYDQGFDYLQRTLSLYSLDDQGFPNQTNINASSNLYSCFTALANAYLQLYYGTNNKNHLRSGQEYQQKAEYILNQITAEIHDFKSRRFIMDKSMNSYELGIEIAYLNHLNSESNDEVEKALQYAESSRNLELNSWMHMDVYMKDDHLYNSISTTKKVLKKIHALEFENKFEGFPKSIKDSLFYFNDQLDSIYSWIDRNYGTQFYSSLAKPKIQLKEIQSYLKTTSSNDIILNYFQGERFSYLIAIWGNHYLFEKLESNSFKSTNLSYLSSLGNVRPRSAQNEQWNDQLILRNENDIEFAIDGHFQKNYNQLYDILLKPALELDTFEKLIVIPDKSISLLPFEAFIQHLDTEINNEPVNFRTLPYIIMDYDVVYEYSISSVLDNQSEVSVPRNGYLGLSPFNKEIQTSKFNYLPYSENEIAAGYDYLGGKLLLGSDASKSSFITEGLKQKVVHLATHGSSDNNGSYLYFYNDEKSEDYALSLEEVYTLDINTELLLLSSCDSGKGELKKGEGIINFGRVFLANGCKSVIEGLWLLNDKAGSTIIQNLFKNLQVTNDLSSSLSEAKRQYIKETENQMLTHPFFWASLVQRGDAIISIQKSKNYLYLIIISSALLFAFLILRIRNNNAD